MLKGSLNLSRRRDDNGNSYIYMDFIDEKSWSRFLQVNISSEAMMEALTNLAERPIEFDLKPDLVGKTREHKIEVIPCKPYGMKKEDKPTPLVPYEVDGWKTYLPDLDNSHNYSDKGIKVTFTRYID